mmetsp:Transcript_11360/g.20917  ORF Transcript_11360/g.20917 Transcript_11360/m.20917 type:complete len:106 (-) Transcript_11360:159-476(-)
MTSSLSILHSSQPLSASFFTTPVPLNPPTHSTHSLQLSLSPAHSLSPHTLATSSTLPPSPSVAASAVVFFFLFRSLFLVKCLHSSQSIDGTRRTSVNTNIASVNN